MSQLEIRLHGERIGTLSRERGGKTVFAFDDHWLERDSRPTLSVLMTPPGVRHPALTRQLTVGGATLPPFFENLMPENESRVFIAMINGAKPSNGYDILARTGGNLFGAVQAISLDGEVPEPKFGARTKDSNEKVHATFSLAGVQRKMSMRSAGARITMAADDDYIIKIPDPEYKHLVQNELGMMRLAKAAGFEVPDVATTYLEFDKPGSLIKETVSEALVVKRFDRTKDGRIHAEDMAQAAGILPSQKYAVNHEFLASIMKEWGIPTEEIVQRIALNVVTGNGDGHAKNFALVYPDGIHPRLAPVYDVVSTVVYDDNTLAMKLGGAKEWGHVDEDSFAKFADRIGADPDLARRAARDTVERVLGAWHEVKGDMPDSLASAIERHWTDTCALTRRRIHGSGWPDKLPRMPDFPTETHQATRGPDGSVVRRKSDRKVDNPVDAAVVKPDGTETFMLDGTKVPKERIHRQEQAEDHKSNDGPGPKDI